MYDNLTESNEKLRKKYKTYLKNSIKEAWTRIKILKVQES